MGIDNPALVDTNALVYAVNPSSPQHESAKNLWMKGLNGEIPLCVSPQIFLEFFSTVTNPTRFDPPRRPEEAIQEIRKYLLSSLLLIFPTEDTLERLLGLAEKHMVKAQEMFDLQLIATMLSNGVDRIYTYNVEHFKPFDKIEVLSP